MLFNGSTVSGNDVFVDKNTKKQYTLCMEKNENLTAIIAENLVYYRKKAKLTQSELANKLNYSDKSVSKWERAEGVPDIYILNQLAKLYGLSVNDFLTTRKKEKVANLFVSRLLITLLSVGMVWFVATFAFCLLILFFPQISEYWKPWLIFIYSIPASCIVLIVFNNIYFKRFYNIIPVSLLCWSIALSLFLSFLDYPKIEMVFIAAIPFQILVVLFYLLLLRKKRK